VTIDTDLDLFFSFGASSVTAGAVSGLGLLMMPGEIIADGMVLTTDYELTVKTSEFGNLQYGTGIVVDAVPYTVRNVKPIDDGRLSVVQMQATVVPSVAPVTPAVLEGDGIDTESEVIMDGGTPGTTYIYDNALDGGTP
jgi:hypothetical protein